MLNLLFLSGHLLARSFRLLQHLSLLMMLPVEKTWNLYTSKVLRGPNPQNSGRLSFSECPANTIVKSGNQFISN